MFEWILDNLPVFINIDCKNSKSIDVLILSPLTATAIVKMKSGAAYGIPVRRLDMFKIRQYENVGNWLNEFALV